jgi:hypothetical protein
MRGMHQVNKLKKDSKGWESLGGVSKLKSCCTACKIQGKDLDLSPPCVFALANLQNSYRKCIRKTFIQDPNGKMQNYKHSKSGNHKSINIFSVHFKTSLERVVRK